MFSPSQHKQTHNTVESHRNTSSFVIENNRPPSLAQQHLSASGVIQRVEVSPGEAKALYDSAGREKWREFIDLKDQPAAEKENSAKGLNHPGEYYDYFREDDGKRNKGNAFHDFVAADAFVQSRIGKKMTAAEYVHINHLAMASFSASMKGIRGDTATWGLSSEATREQIGNITSKGLIVEPDKGRNKVSVPMPKEGMQKKLEAMFNQYHAAQEGAKSGTDKFNNIIDLYMELDALHPFKDGTARTNHLLLNKLLSEHGLGPTLLQEPNSPMFTKKEFGSQVLEGIALHKRLASKQDGASIRDWQRLRPAQKSAMQIRMEKQAGIYEGPEEYKPPRDDHDQRTQKIDLDEEPKEEDIPAPPNSPRVPIAAPRRQYGQPPSLSLQDRVYLSLFMGPRKLKETEKLYADQQRRFRDKQNPESRNL